jgi:hypothetical protein
MDRLTDIAELLFLSRHRLTNNRSDYRDCHADSSDMVTPELRFGSQAGFKFGLFFAGSESGTNKAHRICGGGVWAITA